MDYLNTVAIRDVQNSNTVTSTGLFSLRIVKGSVNEFDRAYFFGQVGFSGTPTTMAGSSISVTANDGPNLYATYQLGLTFASGVIPSNGTLRVRVPSALTVDQSRVTVSTSPSLGTSVQTLFYRDYIILAGLTSQTLASLTVTIANLKNPSYSGNAGTFTAQLRANGTETVVETVSIGPAMVSAAQIPVANIILTSYDVDVASMTLFSGDTVNYEISAKIVNSLPDDCGIVVEVPAAFTSISRCWGMTNLVDLAETTPITCTVVGNLLKLNNLKGIYKYKSVKVGLTATNPVVAADTVISSFNVFTYADRTYTKLVDQSAAALSVTIKGSAGSASTVAVTTTPLPSNTILTSFTMTFTAGTTFTDLRAKLLFAGGFTNTNTGTDLIDCRVDKNGAAFVAIGSCSALVNDKNFLEVNMVTTPSLGAAIATDTYTFVITPISSQGFKTPLYAGQYFVQVVLSETSTTTIVGSLNFDVDEASFTTSLMTVGPYTYDYDHQSVYDFAIYMPFGIEQGQWTANDDAGITYFEIRFAGTTFTNVIRNYTAGSTIPCYGVVGLNRYRDTTGRPL
jgi:hypothetical protein